jgi:hypothetical protein
VVLRELRWSKENLKIEKHPFKQTSFDILSNPE